MNNNIVIGQIVRAVGIRGEIKVKPLTDDMLRYKKLKIVYVNGIPYQISSCRFDKAFVFLKLSGIDTRDQAESLTDDYLEIDRINSVDLSVDSYFIVDIVGCKFYLTDGTEIGTVTDVAQYGAADVFTIEKGKAICRCPFLKKLISRIDTESKIIVADKKVFGEVSVYED